MHLDGFKTFVSSVPFFILQEGGLNGFLHSFVGEVMAICRAHVAALGGNALVAYQMSECVVEDNLHKNQVYAMIYKHLQNSATGYRLCSISFNFYDKNGLLIKNWFREIRFNLICFSSQIS